MNEHLLWTLLALGPLLGRITADLNSGVQLAAARTPTRICPRQQRPVCATNGTRVVLLPNRRQLALANQRSELQQPGFVEIALGFCEKCQLQCPADYRPLCAVDANTNTYRTFNNGCEMRRDACLMRKGWKILNPGPCPQYSSNLVTKSRVIRNIFAPQVKLNPGRDDLTYIMTPPIYHTQYVGMGVIPKDKVQPYNEKVFPPAAVQVVNTEEKFQHWNGAPLHHTTPVTHTSGADADFDTNKKLATGDYQGMFVIPSMDSNVPYENLHRLEKVDEPRRQRDMGAVLGQGTLHLPYENIRRLSNEPQTKSHYSNQPEKFGFMDFYRQRYQSAHALVPHARQALKNWENTQMGFEKTFVLDSMERDMAAPPKSFDISQHSAVPTNYGDIYGLSMVLNKPHGTFDGNRAATLPYHKVSPLHYERSGSFALSSKKEAVGAEHKHEKNSTVSQQPVGSSMYLKSHEKYEGDSSSVEQVEEITKAKESLTDNRNDKPSWDDPEKSQYDDLMPSTTDNRNDRPSLENPEKNHHVDLMPSLTSVSDNRNDRPTLKDPKKSQYDDLIPSLTDNRNDRPSLKNPDKNLYDDLMPRNNSTDQLNQGFLMESKTSATSERAELQRTVLPSREHSVVSDDVNACKLGSTPVCASSFLGEIKSFKNLCDLERYEKLFKQDWTLLHLGACESCPDNCSGIYEPICVARSGVNFTLANTCYLELAKCRHKNYEWKMLTHGECQRSGLNIQPSKENGTLRNSGVADVHISVRSKLTDDRTLKSVEKITPKAAHDPQRIRRPSSKKTTSTTEGTFVVEILRNARKSF